MARTRRAFEGALAAWNACAVIAFMPFTGKALDPNAVNPFGVRDPELERKKDEVRRFVAARAWAVRVDEEFAAAEKRKGSPKKE